MSPRLESSGSGVRTRAGYASRLGPVRRLPASNSPNGTFWSSDGSLGPAMGSSRSEHACARSAANAAWAFQRWFRACRAALVSPCPRELSQERQGAAADSRTNFHAEDNQAAAPGLPQFRVSSVSAVDCLVEGEARLVSRLFADACCCLLKEAGSVG